MRKNYVFCIAVSISFSGRMLCGIIARTIFDKKQLKILYQWFGRFLGCFAIINGYSFNPKIAQIYD